MLKVFSTFSGLGAFELALKKVFGEEFNIVGYLEIDKYASQVYNYHFTKADNFGDILNIDTLNIPDFDILVGGPPCQPYSNLGKREGKKDFRAEPLISKYIDILDKKRPSFFIFENIKSILNKRNIDFFNEILENITKLGYLIEYKVLNTADYGIPQRRNRVFLVGYLEEIYKNNLGILNIEKENLNIRLLDLLEDINNIEEKYIYNYKAVDFILRQPNFEGGQHKNRLDMGIIIDTDNEVSPTLTANLSHGYPTNVLIDRRYKNYNYCRYGFNSCQFVGQEEICKNCIEGDNYQEMYPNDYNIPLVRKILPIECERLQGLPENYTKYGFDKERNKITKISDTQRYKMIGNSISINILERIFQNIIKNI